MSVLRRFASRRFFFLLALVLAMSWSASAPSQSQDAQQPVAHFTSRASLVLVRTIVTDKSGTAVTGLTKDDFYLVDNKQAQKISIFEEINTQPGEIRRIDPHDNGFTNAVAPEAKTQRLTMILLDTLNTQFSDQARGRRELLKLVEETLKPGEPVALLNIRSRGLNVLNDFTTDPTVLAAAIKKVRGEPSTAEHSADEQADLESSLQLRSQTGRAPNSAGMIADSLDGFQNAAFERFQQFQLANSADTTLRACAKSHNRFQECQGENRSSG
jgi:VWFA-related protein